MTVALTDPYRSAMSRRASPVSFFRALPKMQRVDALATAILTVLLLVQLAFVPDLEKRLWVALIYVPICVGVGFRRSHPVIVGFGTQGLLSATFELVHGPAGAITIAWFCALYALAVWTRTRTFVVALVFVVLANGGPGMFQNPGSPGAGAQFGLVAAAVMVLIRVAVGGR